MMQQYDLKALLRKTCIEMGIKWEDVPGESVINGESAESYLATHSIFDDSSISLSFTATEHTTSDEVIWLDTNIEWQEAA